MVTLCRTTVRRHDMAEALSANPLGAGWDSVYWVPGDLLWPACTDSYLQGSQMKLKIDQTM